MARRVLCIDDDPPMLTITAEMLRQHGFAVTAVSGNDEALAHLERDPQGFDVVIQDSQRPFGRCLAAAGEPDDLHELSGVLFLSRHIWRLNPRGKQGTLPLILCQPRNTFLVACQVPPIAVFVVPIRREKRGHSTFSPYAVTGPQRLFVAA